MVNFIVDCTSVGKTRGPNPLINHSFPLHRHGTTLRWTEVIVCHKYIMFDFLILSQFAAISDQPKSQIVGFYVQYIYICPITCPYHHYHCWCNPSNFAAFASPLCPHSSRVTGHSLEEAIGDYDSNPFLLNAKARGRWIGISLPWDRMKSY